MYTKKRTPEKVAGATTLIGTACSAAGTIYRHKQHKNPSTTNASSKRKALNNNKNQRNKNNLSDLNPEGNRSHFFTPCLEQLPASNLNVMYFAIASCGLLTAGCNFIMI